MMVQSLSTCLVLRALVVAVEFFWSIVILVSTERLGVQRRVPYQSGEPAADADVLRLAFPIFTLSEWRNRQTR